MENIMSINFLMLLISVFAPFVIIMGKKINRKNIKQVYLYRGIFTTYVVFSISVLTYYSLYVN